MCHSKPGPPQGTGTGHEGSHTSTWAVSQPRPTHNSPSFPVLSGKCLGMKYAVAESRSISDKVLNWDDEAPSPADVFCLFPLLVSSACFLSISIEDSGGLRSLGAGGEINPKRGIPQGATSPAWMGSGGTAQRPILQHAGAWGALLLSQASYCQQLNKLIGRIFPRRRWRFLI